MMWPPMLVGAVCAVYCAATGHGCRAMVIQALCISYAGLCLWWVL